MERKLPVIAAFSHALNSTFSNLGFAWHVSWPWIIAIMPFNVASGVYATLNPPQPGELPGGFFVAQILVALFTMFAFASIAVSWHRYILRDEVPQGWDRLRSDYAVWRYFGNTLLIILLLALASIPFSIVIVLVTLVLGQVGYVLAVLGYIAMFLAGLAFFYRCSVKLPAIALERQDFTLRDALSATQGNFWQLVGLALLFLLVAFGIGLVLAGLTYGAGLLGVMFLLFFLVALQVLVNWVVTVLGVTLLTSLYGFFVEKRDF